jgi:hypothetical protein
MFVSIVLWALEGNEGYHIHPRRTEHPRREPSPGHPH